MDWFQRMRALGLEVEASLLPGFRRLLPDGTVCPLTNVEMQAAHVATYEERMLDRACELWSRSFVAWCGRGCPFAEEFEYE